MASATSGSQSLANSITTWVSQYQSSLQSELVAPVQTKQAQLQSRLAALSALSSQLMVLRDSASAISKSDSTSEFSAYSVSNSDSSVVQSNATSSAVVGNHTLFVSQIAQADTIISSRFTSSSTGIVSNELTSDEKTAGSATRQINILVGGNQVATVDVPLTWSPDADTNATVLSSIASAINGSSDASQYVTASVVSVTPTQSRLVVTSKTTGSSNAISLEDVGSGTLLANIGLGSSVMSGRNAASTGTTPDDPIDNPGGYLIGGDTGLLDAKFTLDGIDFERPSNTVSDALTGVTFTLQASQAQNDSPVTLGVGLNTSQIQGNVQSFLSAYNSVINTIQSQTAINTTTGATQIFSSDSFIKDIKNQLASIVINAIPGLDVGSNLLSSVGITRGSDGTLTISDSAAFTNALTTSPTEVSNLFNSSQGLGSQINTYLATVVGPTGTSGTTGEMNSIQSSVNDQITTLTKNLSTINASINKQVQNYQDELAQLQVAYEQGTEQLTFIQQFMPITG